ncbi:hypothetical protein KTF37_29035 [Burkholderia multivorans]|uniref:hypothetical protein n=1 Tax=Burkholderia multivorans TaxID=87883 RepID=UPI001C230089|nr:hypothetical protein [Burkholderia multivorans]MBU9680897.1 hypothetical protein [Burkholderia multivorans]
MTTATLQTIRSGRRRTETIPQTGAPTGALAEGAIQQADRKERNRRPLRFRDGYVEVPLVDSTQSVRVALWDFHWLHHVKGIGRRRWTRGEHGEIRAPMHRGFHLRDREHGYDYDVGALLLGLKQGDCYEMDYPCSLMPDTIRQVPRSRSRKKVRKAQT